MKIVTAVFVEITEHCVPNSIGLGHVPRSSTDGDTRALQIACFAVWMGPIKQI
jgi:hypothetical protein